MSRAISAITAALGRPMVEHHGAGLAVEVHQVEGIHVGNMKATDTKASQRKQMHSTNPPTPAIATSCRAEQPARPGLPSDVAREGFVVMEGAAGHAECLRQTGDSNDTTVRHACSAAAPAAFNIP